LQVDRPLGVGDLAEHGLILQKMDLRSVQMPLPILRIGFRLLRQLPRRKRSKIFAGVQQVARRLFA
jgi:hypothetical protein